MSSQWSYTIASRSTPWEFRIEQKLFVLQLSKDGGSVIVKEKSKQATFELIIDIAAAVWMTETLEEALVKGDIYQFVRKYRGSNFVLIAEKFKNKKGVFLKFSRIRNGEVNHIMVPGGNLLWGWKKMAECLGNIVGRRYSKRIVDRSFPIANKSANINRVVAKKNSDETKNWKIAITIYRANTKMSWAEINSKLESITKKKSRACQVATDRAIFWCLELEEFEQLLLKPSQLSSYKTNVKMDGWKKDDHWQDLQIRVQYSWIEIEGFPLLMWNIHFFFFYKKQLVQQLAHGKFQLVQS